ncbi:MAG: hypothetical protein AB4060_06965 [Crocosphaera sp.]
MSPRNAIVTIQSKKVETMTDYNLEINPVLLQQNVNNISKNINYAIGLVVICLLILILLWLPDLLKGKSN